MLCSVFPKIASLTKLHYLFLKPCLYLLCFNVIFISSSDLWKMEICTLGENHAIQSLLPECSLSLYIQKWMDIFSQPYSPWMHCNQLLMFHGGFPQRSCNFLSENYWIQCLFALTVNKLNGWDTRTSPAPDLLTRGGDLDSSWGSYCDLNLMSVRLTFPVLESC